MAPKARQKEKTRRAFRAYFDLIDTADWLKNELRGQLESFDVTYSGLRVLEMLYREGRMAMGDVARARQCNRQNMDVIVTRLEERGWVRRALFRLPPVEIKESLIPRARRGQPRLGRRIAVVKLTPAGEKFVGNILPRHAKVVKAFMRALMGREQLSLSRLCNKLRERDVLKFVSEMTHEDVEDED
jgi:DNA-binding MarR family transcriptional regulator